MALIYVQIRKNKMTVRNVDTQREVSGSAAFTTERLLVGNFFEAEKLVRELSSQVMSRTNQFLSRPGLLSSLLRILFPGLYCDLLVHALEMNHGGLSQVEERVLKEITARFAFVNNGLVVFSSDRTMSDTEAREVFDQRQDME
ncbi:YjaA family stress response protein [Hafnia alvei]|uniref:Uncharacterized protein n=1 Tax=Hafnia alvei TaxID=569 RepID=A0A1C6YUP8_HAFAL|nr:YjaA family stress response protein [Hafnia alvei]NLS55240.1 hypothetical protein [Hafnia alvei]SCM50594.1 hypothetical protein BN1044_00042 [Hafnia alvei]